MLLIYLYNNKIIYIVTNVYINSSKLNYNLSNKIYIITKFNKKYLQKDSNSRPSA